MSEKLKPRLLLIGKCSYCNGHGTDIEFCREIADAHSVKRLLHIALVRCMQCGAETQQYTSFDYDTAKRFAVIAWNNYEIERVKVKNR